MGLFGHHDDKEAQEKQRYEEAQRKLEEARRHQQQQAQPQQHAQPAPQPHPTGAQPGTSGPATTQPGPLGGQHPGAGMNVPASSTGAAPSGPEAFESYTVKPGDTLTGIAHHFFGKASAFKEIMEANHGTISDPDKIRAGQVIRIPKRPVA